MIRRRPLRRVVRAGALAVVGAATTTVLVPDVLRLDGRLPMIATVAWRPQAAVAATVAAAALGVWRPARPTATVTGAAAVAALAALGTRMRRPAVPAVPAGQGDLTIMTVNVFSGRADTGDLAALIEREAPDLVVLPEAGSDFRDKLAPLVAGLGYRGWAASAPGVPDIMGVVVLAGPHAGNLQVRPGRELHYHHLRVSGGVLGRRELFAVHTTAPRNRRLAARWRRELEQIGRWTGADPAPLVVGDLNATLDHGPLRRALGGCVPAVSGPGGLVGTFPAATPRWLGIQIDHILVPRDTLIDRFAVRDVAGTDHRGVVVRVRLPPG